jgi:hypothetical protein
MPFRSPLPANMAGILSVHNERQLLLFTHKQGKGELKRVAMLEEARLRDEYDENRNSDRGNWPSHPAPPPNKELTPGHGNPNFMPQMRKTLREAQENASSGLILVLDEDFAQELKERFPNTPWVKRLKSETSPSATPREEESSSQRTGSSVLR